MTQEGYKIRQSAVALEIGAYASAGRLSVVGGMPSLEAHTKVAKALVLAKYRLRISSELGAGLYS